MCRQATGMGIAQGAALRLVHTLVRRLVSVQRHTHCWLTSLRSGRAWSRWFGTLGTIDFELRVLSQEAALREQRAGGASADARPVGRRRHIWAIRASAARTRSATAHTGSRCAGWRPRSKPRTGSTSRSVPSAAGPGAGRDAHLFEQRARPSPRARRAAAASRHTRSLIFARLNVIAASQGNHVESDRSPLGDALPELLLHHQHHASATRSTKVAAAASWSQPSAALALAHRRLTSPFTFSSTRAPRCREFIDSTRSPHKTTCGYKRRSTASAARFTIRQSGRRHGVRRRHGEVAVTVVVSATVAAMLR